MAYWNLKGKRLAAVLLVAGTACIAAVAKDRAEPFAAGAQIVEWLVPGSSVGCDPLPASPNVGVGTINGTGLATSIGKFSISSLDCVRSTNRHGFYPPFNFSSTDLTLTADNGDQIIASYSGSADIEPSGLLRLSGTFSFTSGTGRFKGVKGGGMLLGVEDISVFPARGFVTLTGTIDR